MDERTGDANKTCHDSCNPLSSPATYSQEPDQMSYHITGVISSAIFLLTIVGLWAQLVLIWKRRKNESLATEQSTAVMSVNQFVSSFLAFFSFFLYGACLDPFNHYLVWPRLIAAILTLAVLVEIFRDRRDLSATMGVVSCFVMLAGSSLALVVVPGARDLLRGFSQSLIVLATILLAQGYLHQVILIRQTGQTGGISIRLHQFFLSKDLATLVFAATMGFAKGWPVMLLSAVSATTKVITLWHFRWVRLKSAQRVNSELPP